MIEIRQLERRFGDQVVLQDITASVKPEGTKSNDTTAGA